MKGKIYRLGEDPKTMKTGKVYSSNFLDDDELSDRPESLINPVGNPIAGKMDGNVEVGENLFKIEKTLELEVRADSTHLLKKGSTEVSHKLGYKPFVLGAYIVTATNDSTYYPVGNRGFIPEARVFTEILGGDVYRIYVEDVDENNLTISIEHASAIGPYIELTIKCRLFLLRELTL